ncbi:glycosyltransferase [Bradyrhizobium hipponense]|uniref:Glycosyltransferase n=1 Tax=Bradyrhizobium hipponense TaxID=2605638 RepID=A0A5S4Y9Y7_9BRAD|nr:glycosyltransferase [Bradyrhizobium hipponense]TYO61226.1 glycosyltransferase [Bradyrhizobium hipponense]
MKILHIIPTANPSYGGPVEGIFRSCAALAVRYHQHQVVTLDHPSDPWVKDSPIPIIPLGTLPHDIRQRRKRLPWVHYGYTPKLIHWLKEHAPEHDVVVVNGLWNFATAAARWSLLSSNVRYFVYTHGMLDPWFRRTSPVKTFFKQVSWLFNEGPLLAGAAGVLFTCEEERMLAHNSFWPYRAKEVVVGYGTADVTGDKQTQIESFRTQLPALGSRKFLLFLSRIHPKKGCDLLIEAFANVVSDMPDLDLVMAGPDQIGWAEQLKAHAASLGLDERIHWPGMLNGDQKWGAFHGSEAFILPSHQENFGIVVVEALACSKPVLITKKVNIWREIADSGAGLIASDDQNGINSLLESFAKLSPTERRDMAAAARATFCQHFDINENIEKFIATVGSERKRAVSIDHAMHAR